MSRPQDEDKLEERELQIHREESNRLVEANEEWFKEYEKEFDKSPSRAPKGKRK